MKTFGISLFISLFISSTKSKIEKKKKKKEKEIKKERIRQWDENYFVLTFIHNSEITM